MRNLVLHTLISSALILSLSLPAVSHADEVPGTIVMSSGIRGGGYWSAATRLQGVAAELGLDVEVLESRGSLHNLLQLDDADSPVSVTLTQADALQYYLDKNPALAQQGEILEHIGQECVFMISAKGSGIRTVLDLAQQRIAIGSAGSGVAVTFEYMATLAPELAGAQVVYTDTTQALDQLNTASSVADAVMVVHRPKEHSAELDRALAKPQAYQLVEIADPRFGRKLPNGDAVYNSLELALPVAGSRGGLKTICTKGLLVSNKHKLTREQRYRLDDVLNYHWMRVYVPGS
jgi:TRAP-type uncharacterized transport system substrate-binding protein